MVPKIFSGQSFQPIPDNRTPYFATHDQSQPRKALFSPCEAEGQMFASEPFPALFNPEKLSAMKKTAVLGKFSQREGVLANDPTHPRSFLRDYGNQDFSPFLPPTLDHIAPVGSGHPFPKAMGPFPFNPARLIGSFHFPLSLHFNFYGISAVVRN
jgi:hypothetical protein